MAICDPRVPLGRRYKHCHKVLEHLKRSQSSRLNGVCPRFALSCRMVMLCLLLAGHLLLLATDDSRCSIRRRIVSLAMLLLRLAKLLLMPFLYGPLSFTDRRASVFPPRFVTEYENFWTIAPQCPACIVHQATADFKTRTHLWRRQEQKHVFVRGSLPACRQHKCCLAYAVTSVYALHVQ